MKDIFVKNVDVDLLRKQRNWLLKTYPNAKNEYAEGIINLLDFMLDEADGLNK
jgi:hypothetical protein